MNVAFIVQLCGTLSGSKARQGVAARCDGGMGGSVDGASDDRRSDAVCSLFSCEMTPESASHRFDHFANCAEQGLESRSLEDPVKRNFEHLPGRSTETDRSDDDRAAPNDLDDGRETALSAERRCSLEQSRDEDSSDLELERRSTFSVEEASQLLSHIGVSGQDRATPAQTEDSA